MPKAPAPGRRTGRDTRGRLAGLRFSGFTLVILAVLVLATVVLAPTLHTLIAQRQQVAALQETLHAERDKVSTLRGQLARWDDPSYIRAQARDRLLYVMPGDTSYLVIDDRAKKGERAEKGAPVSTKIQRTPNDWVRSLFSSTMTAGLSEAPASRLPTEGR